MPEHSTGIGALPPHDERPRWCRDSEPDRRWLPWEVKATLGAFDGHHRYLTGPQLASRSNVGVGTSILTVSRLEELGLLTAAPERELFPETWTAKGHDEDCKCLSSWYYSLTPRGHMWLENYPAKARPPFWGRPGFWVFTVLWAVFCWMMGTFVF